MGSVIFNRKRFETARREDGSVRSKQVVVQLAEFMSPIGMDGEYLGPKRAYHLLAMLGDYNGHPPSPELLKPMSDNSIKTVGNVLRTSEFFTDREVAVEETVRTWSVMRGLYNVIRLKDEEESDEG